MWRVMSYWKREGVLERRLAERASFFMLKPSLSGSVQGLGRVLVIFVCGGFGRKRSSELSSGDCKAVWCIYRIIWFLYT